MKRRHDQPPASIDESDESEITIQPDGRIFAFGITKPLVAVLAAIPTSDERTRRLLKSIGNLAGEPRECERPARAETQ
jgi:hypothetical protein